MLARVVLQVVSELLLDVKAQPAFQADVEIEHRVEVNRDPIWLAMVQSSDDTFS